MDDEKICARCRWSGSFDMCSTCEDNDNFEPFDGVISPTDFYAKESVISLRAEIAHLRADAKLGRLVRENLSAVLGEAYFCTKVWEAWGYGTMSQQDFEPIDAQGIIDGLLAIAEEETGK